MIPQSHLISEDIVFDRALAALTGLAIGDALGMPSQTLPPQDIKTHYGTITGFVAPFPDHPVSHGLTAGQVTDDTEQALILAARLIEGGGDIDERQLAKDFLAWEENVKARGLRDLLGPSTKLALDAILAGQPLSETGKAGTTNGAAMRITPIGIATPIDHLEAFVDKVEMACRMTHNTGEAIASAAAVAAVISCGLNGQDFASATKLALLAADIGQKRGYQVGETDMAQRIKIALSLAEGKPTITDIAKSIGNSVASHESVAAAFAIVRLADGDPWQAALMAANIGDDTDTIGAIAGAMAGACSGISAIPKDAIATINKANNLALETVACHLLVLRHRNLMTQSDDQGKQEN
jgi:ADP-ribosylglycohydrolase